MACLQKPHRIARAMLLSTVLPKRLAMMLVRVKAGHTVLPKRLAMMLVRVEADHTVLPERLAMMLVAVEVGLVVGHVLSCLLYTSDAADE